MVTIPKFRCAPGCSSCCGAVPFTLTEKIAATPMANQLGIKFNTINIPGSPTSFLPDQIDGSCGFLRENKCAIYNLRPLVCRLFGVVDHPYMFCSQGGKPDRLLSNMEAQTLINANRKM